VLSGPGQGVRRGLVVVLRAAQGLGLRPAAVLGRWRRPVSMAVSPARSGRRPGRIRTCAPGASRTASTTTPSTRWPS